MFTVRIHQLACFAVLSALPAIAQTAQNVWPAAPPFPVTVTGPERDTSAPTDAKIAGRPVVRLGNVSVAQYTIYPPSGHNSGTAVIVFPGGGYAILALDLEGTEVCDWLTSRGITCVLLKYRVPNSGAWPKQNAALADAQRTVGIVRSRAKELNIDPARIGVLGFSAGAHLAIALSQNTSHRVYPKIDAVDDTSCRPDFQLLIYPGYVVIPSDLHPNPTIAPTSDTPTTFLVQAEDDDVHVENALVYATELRAAHVPFELHVYARAGHGFGLRPTENPITRWPDLADIWFKTIGVMQ